MNIDVEKIREDLLQDTLGAFFIGGYGGAIILLKNIKTSAQDYYRNLVYNHSPHMKRFVILQNQKKEVLIRI